MIVKDIGHTYLLADNKTGKHNTILSFYKDQIINSVGYEGTTNQEVLRALIDRVKFLDTQKPHPFNTQIIKHLRYALVLHEMRHLERIVDKDLSIEHVVGNPTHFVEVHNAANE